jgi:hypothetical protein
VKVREGLERNDYKDPGWYKNPEGTVAYEWNGAPQSETRAPDHGAERDASTSPGAATNEIELQVIKPQGGHGNH